MKNIRERLWPHVPRIIAATAAVAVIAGSLSLSNTARAGGTLRVGMTAADIPLSWGQPDQGFEGFRFMGLMLYDGLINWDMTSADKALEVYSKVREASSLSVTITRRGKPVTLNYSIR